MLICMYCKFAHCNRSTPVLPLLPPLTAITLTMRALTAITLTMIALTATALIATTQTAAVPRRPPCATAAVFTSYYACFKWTGACICVSEIWVCVPPPGLPQKTPAPSGSADSSSSPAPGSVTSLSSSMSGDSKLGDAASGTSAKVTAAADPVKKLKVCRFSL